MGVSDAPQWLVSAYVRSAQAIGATADKDTLVEHCRALIERWSAPERIFHNQRHLINTLASLDEIISASHNPEMLRMAAWYHGAVFNTAESEAYSGEAGEVMAPSADFAVADLTELGVPEENTERIASLIMTLGKHQAPEDDTDASVLVDAELSMLAAPPQDYRKYTEAIAEEYAHIPAPRFYAARAVIIEHLLARRPLFVSPLGTQWEDRAKENLEAELAKVRTKLESFAPEEVSEQIAEAHLPTPSGDPSDELSDPLARPVAAVAVTDPQEGQLGHHPMASFSTSEGGSFTSDSEDSASVTATASLTGTDSPSSTPASADSTQADSALDDSAPVKVREPEAVTDEIPVTSGSVAASSLEMTDIEQDLALREPEPVSGELPVGDSSEAPSDGDSLRSGLEDESYFDSASVKEQGANDQLSVGAAAAAQVASEAPVPTVDQESATPVQGIDLRHVPSEDQLAKLAELEEVEDLEERQETEAEEEPKEDTPEVPRRRNLGEPDEDDEEDSRALITSTLEYADDCLDTAQMRALKLSRDLAPGIPQMTPPEEDTK
ncbi:hypothetical protein BSR28_06565 [Boudabousia liubingyangii]|uniref:HD domain-containing protein n=1 Tax=Boudabousia liubingyangii TaxID=1921764 RepID=UPI00093EB9E0|nr:hypothetical protein [Boudabousia liubingyangii]OKL47067.1 hypothetical protein BSR28_06565 [Boudabousia liubingyangii]